MARVRRPRGAGFTVVEILAVTAVVALLMAMGFILYGSMREAARVAVAEGNLKQVSTGLELYFRKYHSFPPEGSDLAEVLAPFVDDPSVFENPLGEEERPGEDISELYRQPTLDELDQPGNYVTAFPSDDGTTVVILETADKVVRRSDVRFDPGDPPDDLLAQLDPESDEEDEGDEEGFDVDDGGEVTTKAFCDVDITVIGSQFGYADGTLVPIGTAGDMGEGWFAINDGQACTGGETYHKDEVDAGTEVTLRAEIIGAYEIWLWNYYGYPLSYTSTDGSGQVLVYKRGDQPPDFQPGFPCQAAAGDLVAPYIDYSDPQVGIITIAENEAIYLWDFNPLHTGYGIDYQDMIILATAVAAE